MKQVKEDIQLGHLASDRWHSLLNLHEIGTRFYRHCIHFSFNQTLDMKRNIYSYLYARVYNIHCVVEENVVWEGITKGLGIH